MYLYFAPNLKEKPLEFRVMPFEAIKFLLFFSFAAISPTAAGEGQQQSGKNSARPSSVSLRQTYKPTFHRGWCRHICTPLVYVHMCNLLLLLASFQHCQECILHPDSDEQDTWQSTTHPNSHALPPSCFVRIHGRFTSLPCKNGLMIHTKRCDRCERA